MVDCIQFWGFVARRAVTHPGGPPTADKRHAARAPIGGGISVDLVPCRLSVCHAPPGETDRPTTDNGGQEVIGSFQPVPMSRMGEWARGGIVGAGPEDRPRRQEWRRAAGRSLKRYGIP